MRHNEGDGNIDASSLEKRFKFMLQSFRTQQYILMMGKNMTMLYRRAIGQLLVSCELSSELQKPVDHWLGVFGEWKKW